MTLTTPNPNDPTPQEKKVQWESPVTGLMLPLLFGFLGFAGVLVVFQMEYNHWGGLSRMDYRYIPPELITYRQIAVFMCPVQEKPMCFAVQNDSTFIIGTAKPPALSFFDESGTLLQTMDLPEEPTAIVCNELGDIAVAHPEHLALYTAEGDRKAFWQLPDKKSNVHCLVSTPEYLFAADTGKCCIYRFNAKGHLDLTFRKGFVVYASPITMTFSPHNGLLYITNPGKHRVEVFTQNGEYKPELCWGEPSTSLSGFAGCCNPIALAALDDGRILTVEKAIPRIKIFADGKLDGVVTGPDVLDEPPPTLERTPQQPNTHYFTTVPLSEGRIAVFDFKYAAVRIFAPI
jgi:hypothetical protein